jgi:hypothetical protein
MEWMFNRQHAKTPLHHKPNMYDVHMMMPQEYIIRGIYMIMHQSIA